MNAILLLGAAYNFYGGATLLHDAVRREVTAPRGAHPGFAVAALAGDYLQLRLFVAATALTLGALYIFLYLEPRYIFPFLIFGAAMKYAAFGASLIARVRRGLPQRAFVVFGLGNLALAIAFTVLLFLT